MNMKRWLAPLLFSGMMAGCSDAPTGITAPDAPSRNTTCNGIPDHIDIVQNPIQVTVGGTVAVQANLMDSDGCLIGWGPTPPVQTWTTADWHIGRINYQERNGIGYLSGVAVGTSTLTLTVENGNNDITKTVPFQVFPAPVLSTLTVAPNPARTSIGGQVNFSATGRDQYGNAIGTGPITWSIDDPAIATIDANGVASTIGVGQTTVRATVGSVTGTAPLEVTPRVSTSGPNYAYAESYTVTASGVPTGSYHYTWSYSSCTVGEPGCNTDYVEFHSGVDQTTVQGYMEPWGVNQKYKIDIRSSASGPILATGFHIVHGAAEANPNATCGTRIIC